MSGSTPSPRLTPAAIAAVVLHRPTLHQDVTTILRRRIGVTGHRLGVRVHRTYPHPVVRAGRSVVGHPTKPPEVSGHRIHLLCAEGAMDLDPYGAYVGIGARRESGEIRQVTAVLGTGPEHEGHPPENPEEVTLELGVHHQCLVVRTSTQACPPSLEPHPESRIPAWLPPASKAAKPLLRPTFCSGRDFGKPEGTGERAARP